MVRSKLSLVEEVAERIRKQIEDDNLSSGDRLSTEIELLKKHQVSRSVLREAINRLETIGLIEVRQGYGMFVGSRDSLATCLQFARSAMAITPRDLAEFGELRAALECWGARRAAERATHGQVLELEKLVDQLDDDSRSYEESIQIDFNFHRKLLEIAGVVMISNVMVVLQEFVLEGMHRTTHEPRDHRVSLKLHRSIIDAIRKADPDAAEKAMREHMNVTLERLTTYPAKKKAPAKEKKQD